MIDLNTIWFILLGVLFGGYAMLDGFDLGVGFFHMISKKNKDRRIFLNAIGPVWDGNEVWLLTGGGALFAAFPIVYAQVFSGFYLALMLLLAALIFRAVSLELRHQVDGDGWRAIWDWGFIIGSLVPALLYGVAVGNVLRGLPIEADGSLMISFFALLNPYSIVVGLLTLVMFIMHGAAFLTIKTDGELRDELSGWLTRFWMAFVVIWLGTTLYSFFEAGYLFADLLGNPLMYLFFALFLASMIYIPIANGQKKYLLSFISSCVMIVTLVAVVAISMYPVLVPSSIDAANSFTIYNSASSEYSQTAMLIIALLGMPIVIGYTIWIYMIFKGKPEIGPDSY